MNFASPACWQPAEVQRDTNACGRSNAGLLVVQSSRQSWRGVFFQIEETVWNDGSLQAGDLRWLSTVG